jgi:hypothetical protein
MAYPPGSFTKNFAWQHGKGHRGFSKLHGAIRAGFSSKLESVARVNWRKSSKLADADFYIAANFFLFNVVSGGTNIIPVDELVRQAVGEDHSAAFDRLALFAFNLSLGGKRAGSNNGMEFPALWANEFVRQPLWHDGRWQRSALDIGAMDAFLDDRIQGVGRVKCRMNYRHLFELTRFLPATNDQINSDAESWAAPALFLAWDRRRIGSPSALTTPSLITQSVAEEHFKLLGLTQTEFEAIVAPIAAQYVAVGGDARFLFPTKPLAVAKSGAPPPAAATPTVSPEDLAWLTIAGADGAVVRQVRQRLAQNRNQIIATKLKALYDYQCVACGVKLLVGLSPRRFYVEAAHVRPLGKPHNGPDSPANMIVLCPNHHLQFDRGLLTIRMRDGVPVFISRIPGDPINGKVMPLNPKHPLDVRHLYWHRSYFLNLPTK